MFFVSNLTRMLSGPLFAFCALLSLLALTLTGCGSGTATALPANAELAPTTTAEPLRATSDPVSTLAPDAGLNTASTPIPTVDSGRADSTTPLAEDVSRDISSGPSVGYEELLRAIPDTPENRSEVYIDDYALVAAYSTFPSPGRGMAKPLCRSSTIGILHWAKPVIPFRFRSSGKLPSSARFITPASS